jgi:hypothetical protein
MLSPLTGVFVAVPLLSGESKGREVLVALPVAEQEQAVYCVKEVDQVLEFSLTDTCVVRPNPSRKVCVILPIGLVTVVT